MCFAHESECVRGGLADRDARPASMSSMFTARRDPKRSSGEFITRLADPHIPPERMFRRIDRFHLFILPRFVCPDDSPIRDWRQNITAPIRPFVLSPTSTADLARLCDFVFFIPPFLYYLSPSLFLLFFSTIEYTFSRRARAEGLCILTRTVAILFPRRCHTSHLHPLSREATGARCVIDCDSDKSPYISLKMTSSREIVV